MTGPQRSQSLLFFVIIVARQLPGRSLNEALAMPDLFLSYARQDVKHAETLARLLEDAGLSVWWDHRLVAGENSTM